MSPRPTLLPRAASKLASGGLLTALVACRGPASTATETDDDVDDASDFVPEPDMAFHACRHDREPERLDCPAGTKCMPFGEDLWNDECFPLADPAIPIGEPCVDEDLEDGLDPCEVGAMCIPADGGQVCAPFCTLTDGIYVCPSDTQSCTVGADTGHRWCVENCDPTEPTCSSGSCVYVGDGFHCGTPGSKQYGEPCVHGGECGPGMTCAGLSGYPGCEGVSCCTPFCVEGQDSACPDFASGQQCVTGLQAPAAFGHVGVCTWP